ncbi:hypothetical protein ES288_D10G253700v1 [Gossypium darwinii]|uniref:Uncharacterized protein n=1 Tax=Gossypium darwinii TaxID=34276 RepID=A0A5D2B5N4_GOSDA|nr:hypothetical protein ES288_D10G253700v1 [Gossypium darwinii]
MIIAVLCSSKEFLLMIKCKSRKCVLRWRRGWFVQCFTDDLGTMLGFHFARVSD